MRNGQDPNRGRGFRWVGRLALLLMLLQPMHALAQTTNGVPARRLSNGDEITMTVPGRPDLDQVLLLDASGRVSVTEVGDIHLNGLTIGEAVQIVRNRLRVFYADLDVVEIELRSSTRVTLFAIGEVRQVGEQEFAALPSLWDLLLAAGGPTEGADLEAARIVRETATGTSVIHIDISGMYEDGGPSEIDLQDGDTLVIPPVREGLAPAPDADGVSVFGGVGVPTIVEVDEPTHLMDVLMLAGAPLTDADLTTVWWVHHEDQRYSSTLVDVRRFLEAGDPRGNPVIYPGDTIEVRVERPGWITRNLPLILGTLATAATVALAYDRLSGE